MILSESSIRKILKQLVLKEVTRFGSTNFRGIGKQDYRGYGSQTGDGGYSGTGDSNLFNTGNVDRAKLGKTKVNIESVEKMAKATGLRADFVYGLQSRESGGNPRAMALNGHLVLTKYSYANDIPKYQGKEGKERWRQVKAAWRSEGVPSESQTSIQLKGWLNNEIFLKMYKHSPELAVTNAALGFYQVLGHHVLPSYNFDAEALLRDFKNNPTEYGQKAFVIWVQKHPKFKRLVNGGESNWSAAVRMYYGETNIPYVNHVKSYAAKYRAALKQPTQQVATTKTGSSGKCKGLASWSNSLGACVRRGINFHKLRDNKNNYRAGLGGEFGKFDVEFFKDLSSNFGIKRVITLNGDRKIEKAARAAGLETAYYALTDSKLANMSRQEFDRIKALISSGNNLIHCTHGADRTGAIIGRYYIEDLGYTVPDARTDTKKYGGQKYPGANKFLIGGPTTV